MRSILLTLLCLFSFSIYFYAAPVDQETAAKVATNFYFERSNGGTFTISGTSTVDNGSLVLLYIFNGLPGGGYVVVSGDDRVYPVPAYSLTKNYYSGDDYQAPAFTAMIQDYAGQILHHIDYSLPATPEAVLAWGHYCVPTGTFLSSAFLSVQPLLGPVEWGQGCYYNADCPYDSSIGPNYCNRVPVGCGATAMCMVMKYWGFPSQGIGSHSYLHPVYGLQSANFGASAYNWSQMPPVVTSPNVEVAQICYHAGVSVEMDYGPSGSSSYMSDVRDALVTRFGYDSGAVYLWKDNFTASQWDSILKSDLDSNRPVLYRGSDQVAGGHAWVIDGYQGTSNNHYHCNWGWNGYHNGYFYLNTLSPGGYSFTTYQAAITGLTPPVTQAPSVDFSANSTNVAVGIPVSFTNLTVGNPSGWKWYFGDGDSSLLLNPVHQYTQSGQYSVKLIAWNVMGADTMDKINYITVFTPPAPVAEFSASPVNPSVGLPVQFTDLSLNAPLSWNWDFGDGQTSTIQNPQHTYQTVDTFTVTLIVANNAGFDTLTKTDYIVTNPGPPDAGFAASPNFAYPGDTIFFTDLSTNNPSQWYWQFGDGDTSSMQDPWHVYTAPGAYSVSLKAANDFGFDEILKTGYVYILMPPPLPMAWFSADRTNILKGESVTFTDYSFSNPYQWEWSFPGGFPASSVLRSPGPVSYPDHGAFDVQLIVWNMSGSDTLLREKYIIAGTTGTGDMLPRQGVKIWPVPACDNVNILSETHVLSVILRDVSGRIVKNMDVNVPAKVTFSLPLHTITPGIYRLEIHGEEPAVFRQIIIAR